MLKTISEIEYVFGNTLNADFAWQAQPQSLTLRRLNDSSILIRLCHANTTSVSLEFHATHEHGWVQFSDIHWKDVICQGGFPTQDHWKIKLHFVRASFLRLPHPPPDTNTGKCPFPPGFHCIAGFSVQEVPGVAGNCRREGCIPVFASGYRQ